jgi:hypothetical protein
METWSLPSELDQRLPRRVRLRTSYKLAFPCIAAIFLVPPPLLICRAVQSSIEVKHLEQYGTRYLGHVTKKYTEQKPKYSLYYVDYRFSPTPGNIFSFERSVPKSVYDALALDEPVTVVYDPRSHISALDLVLRTTWSDPEGGARKMIEIVVVMFGGISTLIFSFFAPLVVREWHLIRWGQVAQATILSQRRHAVGGATFKLTATYQFLDSQGHNVRGDRKDLPTDDDIKISKRDKDFRELVMSNPTVLYDPNKPWRSMLYPPVFTECVANPPVGTGLRVKPT